MQVSIKNLSVDMEIKNKGMELAIYSPDGETQKGDLYVTKSGLTWCKGKTTQAKGKKVPWDKFIAWVEAQ